MRSSSTAKKQPAKQRAGRTPADSKQLTVERGDGKRREQQRAVETREKILAAAREEFARHGFEGSSTRTIAEAAGIKHSLLIYHFETKAGLWRTVLMEIHQRRRERVQAQLAALQDKDDITKLRTILAGFVRFAASDPHWHWIMAYSSATPAAELKWHVTHYINETLAETGKLIRAAQRAGKFVKGDPLHLLHLFIGAATRIYLVRPEAERTLHRSMLDPEFVEEHTQVCLRLFFRE